MDVTRPHGPTLVLATTYGLMLALVGLWPQHVDSGLGVADWTLTRHLAEALSLAPDQVTDAAQVVANVLLFVPVGFLVAWWLPRASALVAVVVGAGLSLAIELAQWWGPIDRTASWADVVVNAAGAGLGFVAIEVAPNRPWARVAVLGGLVTVVLAVLGVLVWGLVTAQP